MTYPISSKPEGKTRTLVLGDRNNAFLLATVEPSCRLKESMNMKCRKSMTLLHTFERLTWTAMAGTDIARLHL